MHLRYPAAGLCSDIHHGRIHAAPGHPVYLFFALNLRALASWAFLMFSSLALVCAGVVYFFSGTYGRSLASKTSPSTCLGFVPSVSSRFLASAVSGISRPSSR